eukprot:326908-Alexandrium_andersonii.AAC.1
MGVPLLGGVLCAWKGCSHGRLNGIRKPSYSVGGHAQCVHALCRNSRKMRSPVRPAVPRHPRT